MRNKNIYDKITYNDLTTLASELTRENLNLKKKKEIKKEEKFFQYLVKYYSHIYFIRNVTLHNNLINLKL